MRESFHALDGFQPHVRNLSVSRYNVESSVEALRSFSPVPATLVPARPNVLVVPSP